MTHYVTKLLAEAEWTDVGHSFDEALKVAQAASGPDRVSFIIGVMHGDRVLEIDTFVWNGQTWCPVMPQTVMEREVFLGLLRQRDALLLELYHSVKYCFACNGDGLASPDKPCSACESPRKLLTSIIGTLHRES